MIVFDRLGDLASEHAELERALADPAVHADADQARTLAKRYHELTPVVAAYHEWQQLGDDEQTAREFAHEDSAFAAEADDLATQRERVEDRLRALLVPSWRSRPARAAMSPRCSPGTCSGCTRATPSGTAGRPRSLTPR
jgi:protein subunit release factor A